MGGLGGGGRGRRGVMRRQEVMRRRFYAEKNFGVMQNSGRVGHMVQKSAFITNQISMNSPSYA